MQKSKTKLPKLINYNTFGSLEGLKTLYDKSELRASAANSDRRLLSDFIHLLKRMLTYNPQSRITPGEALEHPFFNANVDLNVQFA